ncbi:MAG: hypothetical protein AAFY36_03920 [Bacteroidota bacterium]
MRSQLRKFTQFANSLLPHETRYLVSCHKFQDEERLQILQQVDYNARNINQFRPYDTSIDKRKYNHLTTWIKTRLRQADVDNYYAWMLDLEGKINNDSIDPIEEKQLIRAVKKYTHPRFYFRKFYELLSTYHDFILIRLRYADQSLISDFLDAYSDQYRRANEVADQLRKVASDVVRQYSGQSVDSRTWIPWLNEVFFDESLEGYLRYQALVRLVFISHNHRQYDGMRAPFDYLDRRFERGEFYSKRLLINYYNNRLMMHAGFGEYDKAVKYGYLSVRSETHDYLHYVNNLCAVLLRQERAQEALQLMQRASGIAKQTKNMHNRVGFVAFNIRTLLANGMHKQAEQYGSIFLAAYPKEVARHRWHLFYSVYLEALLECGQAEKLIKTARKYKLTERENELQTSKYRVPMLGAYYTIAQYQEGMICLDEMRDKLQKIGLSAIGDQLQENKWSTKTKKLIRWVPQLAGDLMHWGYKPVESAAF